MTSILKNPTAYAQKLIAFSGGVQEAIDHLEAHIDNQGRLEGAPGTRQWVKDVLEALRGKLPPEAPAAFLERVQASITIDQAKAYEATQDKWLYVLDNIIDPNRQDGRKLQHRDNTIELVEQHLEAMLEAPEAPEPAEAEPEVLARKLFSDLYELKVGDSRYMVEYLVDQHQCRWTVGLRLPTHTVPLKDASSLMRAKEIVLLDYQERRKERQEMRRLLQGHEAYMKGERRDQAAQRRSEALQAYAASRNAISTRQSQGASA